MDGLTDELVWGGLVNLRSLQVKQPQNAERNILEYVVLSGRASFGYGTLASEEKASEK